MNKAYRYGLFIVFTVLLNLWVSGAQSGEFLPDLVVSDVQLNPEFPSTNDIVTVRVAVENAGRGVAQPSRLALRVNGLFIGSQQAPALAPTETAFVEFVWVVSRGKQVLAVEANAFEDIDEQNIDNNTFERVLELTPDLIVESVQFHPLHPQPNAPTVVTVTVRNVGGQPTTDRAALRFKDGRDVLSTLFVQPLDVGQSVQLEVRWQPQPGEHILRFEVDALGLIAESDELNNAFSDIVNVSMIPPKGANLTVRSLQMIPPHPQPGQAVLLSAVVGNIGSGLADAFEVRFEVDGQAVGSLTIPQLKAGEELVVQTHWKAASGERLARVKVDQGGAIVEPDEANNVTTAFLEVAPAGNACTQWISLELASQAAQLMAGVLGLSEEEVAHLFLPAVKTRMEQDFSGLNVRFSLQKAAPTHSRVRFVSESRPGILGIAPLDFGNHSPNDIATVYLGSFVALGVSSQRIELEQIAQAVANTSSHEVGHFLGLVHDADAVSIAHDGKNLMASSNEANSFFEDGFFTDDNLAYLHNVLPLSCNP